MTASAPPDNRQVRTLETDAFRAALLSWYERHHRPMPWRAPPGHYPDPYHEWLSEIMLQQTTVVTVAPYFLRFIEKWPDVGSLAAAAQDEVLREWAGLGYYARARNLHKCAQTVSRDHGGRFPETQEGLRALPGIGEYTAAAIAAIAFGRPACVVDGNVERVAARLFLIETPLPAAKKEIKTRLLPLTEGRVDRPGDFAQALMELGATVCTPKSPKCGLCPVESWCKARAAGVAETLPRRSAKKARPTKYGRIDWLVRDGDGAVLFERRDEKAMLGGMTGLPGTPWLPHPPEKPFAKAVLHSFTHFDLVLDIRARRLKKNIKIADNQFWVLPGDIDALGLPTLFRKAVNLMK